MLVVNSLSFCCLKVFIPSSFLKVVFLGIHQQIVFFFLYFKDAAQPSWASSVSDRTSAVTLFSLFVLCLFPLTTFKIFSLSLVFSKLIVMWLHVVFFVLFLDMWLLVFIKCSKCFFIYFFCASSCSFLLGFQTHMFEMP